jgi:hypothetical protein
MVNIAVIGSRTFKDRKFLFEKVDSFIETHEHINKKDVTIVSGGAIGADTFAREYAEVNNMKIIEYLPDYSYGIKAPLMRNIQIVDHSDYILAFPNKDSKGTWHTIREAERKMKKVIVFAS